MAHPEEINKVAKVQTQARPLVGRCRRRFACVLLTPPLTPSPRCAAQVSEVKQIMMENIEKVLDRGEKLELLVDKTENLRYQADQFQKGGKALRNKMWWQNMKMKLMVAVILVVGARARDRAGPRARRAVVKPAARRRVSGPPRAVGRARRPCRERVWCLT